MITFDLDHMNPVQLAKLYKFLLTQLYWIDEAARVYAVAVANCGAEDFSAEVARA
jgi:hypothetical protein